MAEAFLHYLWQFQYFAKQNLLTTTGEVIRIFETGNRNTHAGPDFLNARVKIGAVEWVGSVEIHVHASGWTDHNHDADEAYENVILHVVWRDDKPVKRNDGSLLPTLELKQRVDEGLVLKYKKLLNAVDSIPCAPSILQVPELTRFSMLDRVLTERLQTKSQEVVAWLQRNLNNWEETCYQLLARNFGFKVNADPFLQLARSLPYKIILKHADKPTQLEALLFGQAGFLSDKKVNDDYVRELQREYTLLAQKYQLEPTQLNKTQWKFLRLRPANFPSVRLAQFAGLLHQRQNLFSRMLETESPAAFRQLIAVEVSAYWKTHYQLGVPAKDEVPSFGERSIDTVLINSVVPLLVAYGKSRDQQVLIDRAVTILQQLPAESNTVTRMWAGLGIKSKTAFDSQALLELNNNFCSKRRCLDCSMGASLLKPLR